MPMPTLSSIRDLTGNAPLTLTAHAAMGVADAIQHVPHKGARLLGAACAFLMLAEAAHLPVTDLMGFARNVMNDGEGRRPEFAAVHEFINHEVLST